MTEPACNKNPCLSRRAFMGGIAAAGAAAYVRPITAWSEPMDPLFSSCQQSKKQETPHYQKLYEDFTEMRFGMFICFNIMSYGAKWGEANYDISRFNPVKLDCNQWAKSAKSAGMKFGLLTTKHHEGFCLWDSKYTKYGVASTPCKKDIVRQYVDAFRDNDLKIGLYYSMWDSTHGIDRGRITNEKIDFIKGQISELLTNYGKIDYFVIDGWYWRMGHREVPYNEIRQLIRDLQPDCLFSDHTHLQAPYHVDIPYLEGPFGAFPAENNTMASTLGHCSVRGNGWFWSEKTPNDKGESAESLVEKLKSLENRYCTFMLNCMPNRDGLLDKNFTDLLARIGERWKPNDQRATLPMQPKPLLHEIMCDTATATSGNALFAIEGRKNPHGNYTNWITEKPLPQTITLDLGAVYSGIECLQIVPLHTSNRRRSLRNGNITHCKIYISTDGENYELSSEENWLADGNMKTAEFHDISARYIRVEILKCNGENAGVTEMAVGSYTKAPLKL
jgi:alpha-L-fucosidase